MNKIPTGIQGFDELVLGGLPENSTTLLSGPSGAGKTIFSLQYLYKGCTEFDENGVFLSLGEQKERLSKHAENFGWDLQELVDEGRLKVVDATPLPRGPSEGAEYVISDRPEREFSINAIAEILNEAIDEVGAERVAVDSLSGLLFLPKPDFVKRHELVSLVRMLADSDCTSLLTTEVSGGGTEPGKYQFEEFLSDGLVRLYYSLHRNEFRRTLTVWKMRGTDHEKGVYSFNIEDDAGIVVRTIAELPSESER